MGQSEALKIIKKFVKALKQEGIVINHVILYGSHARGNARADSDIDVAVVSKDFGKDPIEEGMTLFRLAGKIEPRLEPVAIPIKTYKEDTWIPLIYEIRDKGVELRI